MTFRITRKIMSSQISKIYSACNPNKPATEEFYYDCSIARGGNVFVNEIKTHITLANDSMDDDEPSAKDFKNFLFTGHSGCGKSSELTRLSRELESHSEDVRFFPLFINVDEYLDRFDVTITDVLLAIATEAADILRNAENINLEGNYFQKFFEKLKEAAFTEWEVEKLEFGLPYGLPKVGIKRLAKDATAREKVRTALKADTYLLLQEINLLLQEARKQVKNLTAHGAARNYNDVVIILDNLEKIQKFDQQETSLDSAKRLFFDYSPQLTGIESHIIYTVSIDLMRSSDAQRLRWLYDQSFVLPMVKVFQRDGETEFEEGCKAMKGILEKRLGDIKLEDAFTPDALDLLIRYSGGHIRSFIRFARESCADALQKGLPINFDNADHVIRNEFGSISPSSFSPDTWAILAKLDLSNDQQVETDADKYAEMLEKLILFEYINGDGESAANGAKRKDYNRNVHWNAANPFLRELTQFERAKEQLLNPAEEKPEIAEELG